MVDACQTANIAKRVIVALVLMVSVLAASIGLFPIYAYAAFNDVADSYPAAQDLGSYGRAIKGGELPDGSYKVTARTTSRMCILYTDPADAEARDSKEQAIILVEGGQMTAVFYISKAYTHLYEGTAEQAAKQTDKDGADASAYIAGDPDEGYVPHMFALPIEALNKPMTIATYSGGGQGLENGKWYTREFVFKMTDEELEDAIAAANPEPEPSSSSASSSSSSSSSASSSPASGQNGRRSSSSASSTSSSSSASSSSSSASSGSSSSSSGKWVWVPSGKLKVTLSKSEFTYTGEAIRPAVTVRLGGRKLTEGLDYAVRYRANVNAGKATVVVTGAYPLGSAKRAFRIAKAPIGKARVELSAEMLAYSGKAQRPGVTVRDKGLNRKVVLKRGRDFKVSGRAVASGKGALRVTAKPSCRNYRGSVVKAFRVEGPGRGARRNLAAYGGC